MADNDSGTASPSAELEKAKRATKTAANDAADKAKSFATDTADKVRSDVKAQADQTKDGVASEISTTASALRNAAQEMRSGSPQERTFAQIADGLADASDAVKGKDMSEIMSDTTEFARRNPLIFLGGAALLGFAASRFAKATTQGSGSQSVPSQFGEGDVGLGASRAGGGYDHLETPPISNPGR